MRYDAQNKKISKYKAKIDSLIASNNDLTKEYQDLRDILNNTLHEVRRFSAQLTKFSERLNKDAKGHYDLQQTASSIFYTAGMISSRLAYTDIELNPSAIENQTTVRSGIYKKFDKAKRILSEEASRKRVKVFLHGESRKEIEALPVFELLPFVLLENAIKYSPENQEVNITFEVIKEKTIVTMHSIGPKVECNEVHKLLEKGFRGDSTKTMPGEGRGLFLAKQVCDFHNVKISLTPGKDIRYQLSKIDYTDFKVTLEFS